MFKTVVTGTAWRRADVSEEGFKSRHTHRKDKVSRRPYVGNLRTDRLTTKALTLSLIERSERTIRDTYSELEGARKTGLGGKQ